MKNSFRCAASFRDNGDPTAQIKDAAWIQYRFGKHGHLELIYPAKKVALVGRFSGEYIGNPPTKPAHF